MTMARMFPTLLIVAGLVAGVLALRAMRGKWDLLAEHLRDLARHVIAGVLMLGTLAGTSATFSAGRLTFAGLSETILSVGGIALALEAGAIYSGLYLGKLDELIAHARRDMQTELIERRKTVQRWFYIVVGISGLANFIFRVQTLGESLHWPGVLIVLLAGFVSAVPAVLTVLLLVKLRPLPTDYRHRARQTTARAMALMVDDARRFIVYCIRKKTPLTEADTQKLRMAIAILQPYAPSAEAQALSYGLGAPSGAADNQQYVTARQVAELYSIPPRTAQYWIANAPGVRPCATGRQKEAPLSEIEKAHGRPSLALPAPGRPRATRNPAQIDAILTQSGAIELQEVAD